MVSSSARLICTIEPPTRTIVYVDVDRGHEIHLEAAHAKRTAVLLGAKIQSGIPADDLEPRADREVAEHGVTGQHLGIFLVELGIGITVASVMISIFYVFAERGVTR